MLEMNGDNMREKIYRLIKQQICNVESDEIQEIKNKEKHKNT